MQQNIVALNWHNVKKQNFNNNVDVRLFVWEFLENCVAYISILLGVVSLKW